MRLATFASAWICVCAAGQASAQSPASPEAEDRWIVHHVGQPATVEDILVRLDDAQSYRDGSAPDTIAVARRSIRFRDADGFDSFDLRRSGRLVRSDGAPLPAGLAETVGLETDSVDFRYRRGWTERLSRENDVVDVALTPHIGVGVGSRGGSTEAGATLTIGQNLDELAPDGRARFGDRPRWYVYAAGSGRAVGYNFARDRDGGFARSGVSQDKGAFLGDASIGVGLRRGPLQASLGVAYRELEVENFRAGHGVDTDVSEGVLAFQLSIKPD